MPTYMKSDMPDLNDIGWGRWEKKVPTLARRITGAFAVETSEGTMTCPDGWLAIDSAGNPYPIAQVVFEATYQQADRAASPADQAREVIEFANALTTGFPDPADRLAITLRYIDAVYGPH